MQPHSGSLVWRWRGLKMVGVQNRPALAAGRRAPGVLFLHGFPGSEKNVDVQRALLARGVASFAPYFAGSWGSGGTYRFSTLLSQAEAALKELATLEYVDPKRLAVFGFSMGGWTALNLGGRIASLKAVAVVAPVGGPEMVGPEMKRTLARMSGPLRVPPLPAMARDFAESVRRDDPAAAVGRRGCPILIVHGTKDDVVPFAVSRRLLAAAGARARLVAARGATHAFLDRRPWLTRQASTWLADRLLS
ncbi:MAG: alpha/beta fold hydrolase [Elusimicrobia bacterium]|nr:alpha/beta fold hydrolase [Elusimicrobiota bacterium]